MLWSFFQKITNTISEGGNVTSAGWQVTLCDPMWHVSSCSSVATLRTAIHLLLTYLPLVTWCGDVADCTHGWSDRFWRCWQTAVGHHCFSPITTAISTTEWLGNWCTSQLRLRRLAFSSANCMRHPCVASFVFCLFPQMFSKEITQLLVITQN